MFISRIYLCVIPHSSPSQSISFVSSNTDIDQAKLITVNISLVVGLYNEHACLAVLFFLKASDGASFIALGALMLVLMAVTIFIQTLFQHSFHCEYEFVPITVLWPD